MSIIDHIIGLIETKVELVKIEAKEEISFILSRAMIGLFMGLLLFFGWMFAFMAAGFLLNIVFESNYLGILIIAGFHLILFLLMYFFRGQLGIQWLIEKLIEKLFEKKE